MATSSGLAQVGQRADDGEDLEQPPTKKVVREEVEDEDDDYREDQPGDEGTQHPPLAWGQEAEGTPRDPWQPQIPPYSRLGGQSAPSTEAPLQG